MGFAFCDETKEKEERLIQGVLFSVKPTVNHLSCVSIDRRLS